MSPPSESETPGGERPRTLAAEAARRLMRTARKAGLATLDRQTGSPYVSLVSIADDADGNPLLLLSDLARHTRNLRADARASLLLDGTDDQGDPETGARLTLIGALAQISGERARERYLARLPSAAAYMDFGDFGLWRLQVESGHFIGGFGRIVTLEPGELLAAPPGELSARTTPGPTSPGA